MHLYGFLTSLFGECGKLLWYAAEKNSLSRSAESFDDDNSSILNGISEDSKAATSVLKWFFDGTKAKAMELVEKVINLMNGLFQAPYSKCEEATGEATPDLFMKKLTSSFTISIVVLLIVVLTRTHRTWLILIRRHDGMLTLADIKP